MLVIRVLTGATEPMHAVGPRWTKSEDELLNKAVAAAGEDWSRIEREYFSVSC